MAESQSGGVQEIAFESFGVRAAVSAGPEVAHERLVAVLPPGWRPCESSAVDNRFELVAEPRGGYRVLRDGDLLGRGVDLDLALETIDTQLRGRIALQSTEKIFIHAGVVAHEGRALVIPGASFSGKTTLVAALVRRGAVYYSDEFAVFDDRGQVHPYPKRLSLRNGQLRATDQDVESLGGVRGREPAPVAMVVEAVYRPGASWEPRRASSGEGALSLMANAVAARERPEAALQAVSRAVDGAVVLIGDRPEASEVAPLLLAELAG